MWVKPKGTGHLNAKKMPMNDYELISIFCKKSNNYFPQKTQGKPYLDKSGKKQTDCYGKDKRVGENNLGMRYPKRVINFDNSFCI